MKNQPSSNSTQSKKIKYTSFPFDDFSHIQMAYRFRPEYDKSFGGSGRQFPTFDHYTYTRFGFGGYAMRQVLEAEEYDTLEQALDSMFGGSIKPSDLPALLAKLNKSNYKPQGIGKYKKVFKFGDYAILRESGEVTSNSGSILYNKRERAKKSRLLRDLGIGTPQILYQTTIASKNTNGITQDYHYEVQENAKGLPIGVFRLDAMCLLLQNRGILVPNESISKNDVNRICDRFQLAITKQRALVGQKHLPKFLDDALVLHCLDLGIDFHGENILFNPETGYSFLDLSLKEMDHFENINQIIKRVNTSIADDIADSSILRRFEDIFSSALCLDSCFSFTKQALQDNFPLYVYNGLILEQARKYLCGENPNEEPPVNLKDRKFFQNRSLFKHTLFAMPFDEITAIRDALESGDEALQAIKDKYGFPKSFDLGLALGKQDFMEAFNCTTSCQDSTIPNYQNIRFVQNWFGRDDDIVDFQLSTESDSEALL